MVQEAVDGVNARVGPVEQLKKFTILAHDLSQETRRAHADAEGQAEHRLRQVRGRARRDVPEISGSYSQFVQQIDFEFIRPATSRGRDGRFTVLGRVDRP